MKRVNKNNKDIVKPQRLNRGDTIGIIAPASSFDIENFKRGVGMLKAMGYRVKYERSIFTSCWSKPGHNKQRGFQINRMFADPQVKAIFCAKAGYGSIEILPYLNKPLIRRNPKIFVGYSDITILLLYLQHFTNMVVFHGPVVSDEIYAGMNSATLDYLLRILSQALPLGSIMFPQLVSFKSGKATGTLVGGNLSLIANSISTPYKISTNNVILFLEDVAEDLESIRAYFLRLRRAGKFKRVKGILFGKMIDCFQTQENLKTLVNEVFKSYDIPILFGFPSGHKHRKEASHVTLPLGVTATLDADNLLLQINEAAVV
ncbi:MAG: LD-carboxypeptidase [Candidatus Omnitrophica bacterium]|nr:LD-carboxypeptidase [Candidatus Omnitrophota bacterium]MBU0878060.1 LD-carboxypeptidase [Candidatus Omnitrophota bacterium]MBU0897307.1 LD-carboxypeptidase [Candidatus Omnitrophota bacterium]MBU1133863.1 LD-carboxypeptidase [Candidatus Omnitrophota bacterium]MBU1367375.1 LD-carboxypeptidase [Candidatus Omnitrophota bacterium]